MSLKPTPQQEAFITAYFHAKELAQKATQDPEKEFWQLIRNNLLKAWAKLHRQSFTSFIHTKVPPMKGQDPQLN